MTVPGYMSASEAAKRTGKSRNTVNRACQDGRLPAFRLHNRGPWLIPDDAVPTIDDLTSRNRQRIVAALLANLARYGVTIPTGDNQEAS